MRCLGSKTDFDTIHAVINEAAAAYRGVIPADRWKNPYMSARELQHEMDSGVVFWGTGRSEAVVAVMGIQDVRDVTLIRHAYTLPEHQGTGLGTRLLGFLVSQATRPVLVGTWAAASRAVRFYEKNGFRLVPPEKKGVLLRTYWSIPERQIETSVVLCNRPEKIPA